MVDSQKGAILSLLDKVVTELEKPESERTSFTQWIGVREGNRDKWEKENTPAKNESIVNPELKSFVDKVKDLKKPDTPGGVGAQIKGLKEEARKLMYDMAVANGGDDID